MKGYRYNVTLISKERVIVDVYAQDDNEARDTLHEILDENYDFDDFTINEEEDIEV